MKRNRLLPLTLFFCFVLCGRALAHPGQNVFASIAENCSDEPHSILHYAYNKAQLLIDSFYRKRAKNDGFNGVVLVAKDAKPIYSGSFGYSNLSVKDSMTLQTPVQLASVTKTFTATAIMLLAENGFLSLDDSVQKFFPDFPYQGITVRLLLSHRTGLIDYTYLPAEYFGKNLSYITNADVLNYFVTKKPALRTRPDRMFIYCNTNYALLASIIEQATGMSYAKFMRDMIFSPLGMENTFVYTPEDSTICTGAICYDARGKHWKNNIYDGVTGDKGIYASAEDLLKWDNALRSGLVVSEETLLEAYKPRSLDKYSFAGEKDKNYGYGWRMMKQPDRSYLIYHNGFWHGSNNVFARDIDDGYTVIVLGNKYNQNNYWTQPVWDILHQLKAVETIAEAANP